MTVLLECIGQNRIINIHNMPVMPTSWAVELAIYIIFLSYSKSIIIILLVGAYSRNNNGIAGNLIKNYIANSVPSLTTGCNCNLIQTSSELHILLCIQYM